MRTFSRYRHLAIQLLVSIAIFDIFSALFFRSNVRKMFPPYLVFGKNVISEPGRGYPRFHFYNHDERGFDIRPNGQKILTSSHPAEGDPYYVWGNSLGCFDLPPPANKKYAVYLAGDSFTWGYVPFEQKFGTLLEKQLGYPVAKCGVTHTGQLHQFSKFKEIIRHLGYYPPIVIVNIVGNDVDNDYFFPHSRVVGGYQVENVRWRIKPNKEIEVRRIEDSELIKDYNDYVLKSRSRSNGINWRMLDPRRISSTISLAGEVVKRVSWLDSPTNTPEWIGSPAGLSRSQSGAEATYDIYAETSKRNLGAISKWISDSKANRYRLIFSLISSSKSRFYSGLKGYIIRAGGEVYDFGDYIDKTSYSSNPGKLFWELDGHFNPNGEKLYFEYLLTIIKNN